MDKFLFSGYSPNEREQLLRDNANAIEEKGYMKPFSDDEVNEQKDNLAQTVISISQIEQEKKDVNADFKARLKPLETEKKTLLEHIKNKSEYVVEDCFKIIDHETEMVGYYNKDGLLIESRPIRANERQMVMFPVKKTGTND